MKERIAPSCTVISMVPFAIDETKPGMTPSRFYIDPATEESFSCLLVTKCQHGVYLDEFRPVLIVPTAPEEVAEAICFDYKKGQLEFQVGVAEPGLFWVQGDYAAKEKHAELKAVSAEEFRATTKMQTEWFKLLVAKADDAWGKFHQRAMISHIQKVAAARLKLNREWQLDVEVSAALSECPVCFEKVHPRAIICRGCNAILNQAEYEKRKFAIASTAPAGAKA
jgi:hypothetical protein